MNEGKTELEVEKKEVVGLEDLLYNFHVAYVLRYIQQYIINFFFFLGQHQSIQAHQGVL